ncbi:AgmX/PglI C-terminal domain-containing protein [Methylibium rhizosphaerae]|uniref:AgmX/PglI C-terminal domain-containing protein n=1 Tax=Methylibium rhizosphaerae TaxID=2570323 RepID=UPI00112810D9|nr:AgmX/PglI C-terminal domain-containing protein [Methylibium rhizosphaerae]
MTTTTLSLQEQTLGIAKVSRILDVLEQRRAELDAELETCAGERRKFHLLGTILDSLGELDAAGAADLFWHRDITSYSPDRQLQKAREQVAAFEDKVADVQLRREQVQHEIDVETGTLRRLNTELVELEEEAEAQRQEFHVFRDPSEIPYRPLVMPWSRNGEDDRRYRKVFLASLLVSLSVGSVVFLFKPAHEKRQDQFIPDHVAELIVKKKEEPKKQERKPQDYKAGDRTPAPRSASPQAARQAQAAENDARPPGPLTDNPTGTPDAQQVARASAQTKGVLAHQNEFAGLIDSSGPVKVGAEGVVSTTGQIAPGTATTRSLIVSQVGAGSGGINVAAISRNGNGGGGAGGAGTGTGGGGGGNGFGGSGLGGGGSSNAGGGGGGVKVAKVQSTTGTAMADARPLSQGAAPSRTDEEIQIVFDRYKAALYRIYNRELRNDPSLKGKMVLRLTIEPDGQVSACAVKSTDLASPTLSAEVVERVLKFNFGAKQGVPPITITYPIDFLPAA